jgi:hypothetical protein
VNTVKGLCFKIDNLEKTNKEILDNLKISKVKITTGFQEPLDTIGHRLQKINPETFELIRVYENVSEIMKEDHRMKRPSLNNAIIQNTVYLGYRWLFVDRELDPTIIHKILPNKNTKIQNIGYIEKINKEKTEILNIYIDRKTAAKLNGYISPSALDITVKKYSIKDGYYYNNKMYNNFYFKYLDSKIKYL